MSVEPKVRVGYWKIRGLIQPIRTLLTFCEVPFKFESYEQGEAPEYSREEWLKVKETMRADLEYPNLPYLIDNETNVKITQSSTILRYIARKYGAKDGLYEGTPEELAQIDCALDQVVDLRSSFVRTCYGGMAFQAFYEGILPSFLAGFEAVLSKPGREYLAGSKLSIADFAFHEVLEGVHTMVSELAEPKGKDAYEAYPAIAAYKARFEALPKVAAFRASEDFKSLQRPFNNKVAVWR